LNAILPWDHLSAYVYSDSGRIILFPVVRASKHRNEKAMCQILCPDLLNYYETLIEADLPDEQFEPLLNRKESEVIDLVANAAREADLPRRLGRTSVKVRYYGSDLETPVHEDNFVST